MKVLLFSLGKWHSSQWKIKRNQKIEILVLRGRHSTMEWQRNTKECCKIVSICFSSLSEKLLQLHSIEGKQSTRRR